MDKIVILTGAGISPKAGWARSAIEGGIWTQHALEDVATPEGFARNPALVQDFYNQRRKGAARRRPTPRIARWPGCRPNIRARSCW
jgi:NAD-dependent deacetylase